MRRLPHFINIILLAGLLLYGLWFSLGRHAKTNSGRFDLGNMEQTIWNTIHGRGFVLTDPYGTATVSRFAFHADPFLILLAPFYAAVPRTETLLILQVLAVASGGIALWLLARHLLSGAWWSTLFVGLYVVNPFLHWAMSYDLHAVTFALPLILWAAWATLIKRRGWALFFILLAMLTKEQVGLSLAAFGLYVWLFQRDRKWGIPMTVGPLVWSLLMLFVVLPHFRTQTQATSEIYRTSVGNSAGAITQSVLTKPIEVAGAFFTRGNAVAIGQLFFSTGLISIISPWWLAATPDMVINALSLKPAQHQFLAQYSSTIVPWMFIGALFSTAWIIRRTRDWRYQHIVTTATALFMIIFGLYTSWRVGPLPFTPHDQTKFVTWRNAYAPPVKDWAKRIPTGAAVSVTNNVGAHFARREHLYSFPLGLDKADYIVVLERHAPPVVATDDEVSSKAAELRMDALWESLYQQDDLTVLKRRI